MTNDRHSRTTGVSSEPLYDVNIPTPTHAERARTLVSRLRTGTLCTLATDPPGHPYGSFVTVAFDEGNPVFLVSNLAEHTRNLQNNQRASVLLAESESEDPLANGRVTLLGTCNQISTNTESARRSFLLTHPNAQYYADFKDFSFWNLSVQSARYIGGYGRMSWITASEWYNAEADPLVSACSGIVSHMNEDHAETMVLYCKAFSRLTTLTSASMTTVDRYGFEMSAVTREGPRPIRVAFPSEVSSAEEVRATLIGMLKTAKLKLC